MGYSEIFCTFSEHGKLSIRARIPNKIGIIVGQTKDQRCYRLIWNGSKTAATYHKSFIQTMELVKDINQVKTLAADSIRTFYILTPTGIIGTEVKIKYFSKEGLFTIQFESDGRMFIKITEQELADKTQLINLINNKKLFVQ